MGSQRRPPKENEYIENNKTRCYNTTTPQEPIIVTPIIANGTKYPSLREAARGENVSRTHAKRMVANPSKTSWVQVKEEARPWGKTPIFASKSPSGEDSVFFESFADCIAAGFASNKQNVQRKLQRKTPGWRYAHFDLNNKPSRFPYTLKPEERAYTSLPADPRVEG